MKRMSEFRLEEVKDLINKGKEEGVLTTEEINETLSNQNLTAEQIENIFDVIQNLGIEVVNEEDDDIDSVIQQKKDEDILKKKLDFSVK